MTDRRDTPFLLNSACPFAEDEGGNVWVDGLWAQDLERHFPYLKHLRILAPRTHRAALTDPVRVQPPPDVTLSFADLDVGKGKAQMLARLPAVIATAFREVRRARVVQTSPAGWPYAPAFFLLPAAALFRVPVVTVLESTFWRLGDATEAGRLVRLRARLTEWLARRCFSMARLSVLTSEAYRRDFAPWIRGTAIVTPASWIDESRVLGPEAARDSWRDGRAPRVLFAGRLVREKGVGVLLDALAILDRRKIDVACDVMGMGEMAEACRAAAPRFRHVTLTLRDPVPYDDGFFACLREVRAVVVPSLSDEQPRIVYDAFSQATPVLASDTGGLRDAVREGQTGWRVPPGDADALADAIAALLDDAQTAERYGLQGRDIALAHTHEAMHHARAEALAQLDLL